MQSATASDEASLCCLILLYALADKSITQCNIVSTKTRFFLRLESLCKRQV